MKISFFYFSVLSFIAGVAFCSLIDFGFSFGLFLVGLAGMVWVVGKRVAPDGATRLSLPRIYFFLPLLILFFALGTLRCSLSNAVQNTQILDNFVGQKISAFGMVTDEPDERENNTKLTVEISEISEMKNSQKLGDLVSKSNVKVLMTVPHYPQFEYGDQIKFSGLLKKPKNFKTDGGREFDYVKYLAKDGIFYQMFYPEVKLLSKGNGNFIKEKLFALKKLFLKEVEKTIPEPQVSLLGGLLVGAKQSLGQELQDDFRKVGLIHIVVLSGYNVTIIAEFMARIFSFLPRILGMVLGALSIVLFAVMVGGSATIVRASLMALLVILARATGRTSDMTRALFLAGFVMVFHNPQIVVFDPSFQLSFAATLGLICLSPKVAALFKFVPAKFYLREAAAATISTQIFVLPLLLWMMGELSVVAVFVNLLVLMFIPLTMLFGFLAGALGFISSYLVLPFAYLTYFLLSYELKVVELFAGLPFASIKIPFFPLWLMLIMYGLYFIFFARFFVKSKKKEEKIDLPD
ncbi:MAG: ComEC/Rec2 family competence protein [Candidatus Pacebacteria bacterium]|nr:ComEC/Rec2 family competence protein [Candidatus Paceibacterota bacterium]